VLQVLTSLADDIAITVVLSSRAPHLKAVRQLLRGRMRLLLDLDADSMANLMTEAHLAIGAPGVTAFERAVLGLPSILVSFAENQRGVARVMSVAGAAIDAGMLDGGFVARFQRQLKSALEDSDIRRRVASAASTLIDGRGALRIMLGLHRENDLEGAVITLRLATKEDEAWLLWLQSEPQTRQYARDPSVPTAVEHHAWMERTLSDRDRMLLIIEANREATGMLRLDAPVKTDSRSFEISIAIDPSRHGRGIGSGALRLVRRVLPNAVLDAAVHLKNDASKALFRAAGFAELSSELYRSIPR
jgi:RimJ/RimL family protein N-acetyltransferase